MTKNLENIISIFFSKLGTYLDMARTYASMCYPQLYLMKYGYMEVAETRSAQLLSPDGLLDYILQFQVSPHLHIGQCHHQL